MKLFPNRNHLQNIVRIQNSSCLRNGRSCSCIITCNLSSKKSAEDLPKMVASIQEINGLRVAVEGCVSSNAFWSIYLAILLNSPIGPWHSQCNIFFNRESLRSPNLGWCWSPHHWRGLPGSTQPLVILGGILLLTIPGSTKRKWSYSNVMSSQISRNRRLPRIL